MGQTPVLQFDHITTQHGLSSSSVLCIIKDYKGFMWIGTYNGLNRYDGTKFEIFRNDPEDSLSIYSNFIWSLFEDSRQNLFIGTVEGLVEYDQEKNIFINHINLNTSPMWNRSWIVRSIREDNQNNLWLATNLGLVKYNVNSNEIEHFQHNEFTPGSLSNNNVEHVVIDKKDNIWVSTWNGLNKLSPGASKFKRYLYNPEKGPDLDDYSLMELLIDTDENLWVATYGTGLYKFSFVDDSEPKLKLYKNDPADVRSVSGNRILTLYQDSKNRIWIGTENQGLSIYDVINDKFWQYHYNDYDSRSLNHESINTVFEDDIGNIWVGTFAGGINIAINNGHSFRSFKNMPGANLSLSNNSVTAFLEDQNERIWIATDGGGINLLDESSGTFKRYNSRNTDLNSNNILSLIESNDQIWISTWDGGISQFDPKNRTFLPYTTNNSAIPDNNIFALIEGEEDVLWLGSFQHGLIRFNKQTGTFKQYSTLNSKLLSDMIIVIRKNSMGELLLGTNVCFSVFDIEKEEFTNFLHDPELPASISSNSIYDICLADNESAWIATQNGLNLFSRETNSFTKYFISDSLPDNIIKGLVFDADSNLWITSNSGIFIFDPSAREVKRIFSLEDGLQGNEYNNNSVYRLSDGRILAGGTGGFDLIDPDNVRTNTTIPRLQFTDFLIFNKRVNPRDDDAPLKKHISELDQIILNYDQSMLTFHFAVMDFTKPEKNQYAYKMENFDKDWIYSGNKWEATYTNLNHGDYIFRVIGSNNDGIWNTEGISISIKILPPWWQTFWFRSLAVLTMITLLAGLYMLRVSQLKKQKEWLEKEVTDRTREIEEKNKLLFKQTEELNETNTLLEERQQVVEEQSEELQAQAEELTKTNRDLLNANATKDKFFSIIAHDLKNPFSSILGFSEVLKTKYEKYTEEKRVRLISLINESAENIYRLLENLLQWSRSQTGNLIYTPSEFDLCETVQNNIDLFQNQLKTKNLRVTNQLPHKLMVYADRNMVNTIIRNLISNAVKFTENGEIETKVRKQKDFLKLYISDTGVGIPKDKLKTLFEIGMSKSTEGTMGEMGTGLGLILCKEFAEKNGGKLKAVSSENSGSTFTLSIPVSKRN